MRSSCSTLKHSIMVHATAPYKSSVGLPSKSLMHSQSYVVIAEHIDFFPVASSAISSGRQSRFPSRLAHHSPLTHSMHLIYTYIMYRNRFLAAGYEIICNLELLAELKNCVRYLVADLLLSSSSLLGAAGHCF